MAPAPAGALGCGGRPGRYASELPRQDYQVTLFDLNEDYIRKAFAKRLRATKVSMAKCLPGKGL